MYEAEVVLVGYLLLLPSGGDRRMDRQGVSPMTLSKPRWNQELQRQPIISSSVKEPGRTKCVQSTYVEYEGWLDQVNTARTGRRALRLQSVTADPDEHRGAWVRVSFKVPR